MRQLHAYLLLAWHLVLHALAKMTFLYRRGGIDRVRDNFEHEGLVEFTDRERELMAGWQRCIGCGLCEAACPELAAIAEGRQKGPYLLAQTSFRDLSQADLALPNARAVAACDADRIDAICPTGVPLGELSAFLSRVGEKVEAAKADAAHDLIPSA